VGLQAKEDAKAKEIPKIAQGVGGAMTLEQWRAMTKARPELAQAAGGLNAGSEEKIQPAAKEGAAGEQSTHEKVTRPLWALAGQNLTSPPRCPGLALAARAVTPRTGGRAGGLGVHVEAVQGGDQLRQGHQVQGVRLSPAARPGLVPPAQGGAQRQGSQIHLPVSGARQNYGSTTGALGRARRRECRSTCTPCLTWRLCACDAGLFPAGAVPLCCERYTPR